jgi:hypothetical protein
MNQHTTARVSYCGAGRRRAELRFILVFGFSNSDARGAFVLFSAREPTIYQVAASPICQDRESDI